MTTPQQDAADQVKIEKMLRGHRQAPNGRNAFAFVMTNLNNGTYRKKFNKTFKGTPGSEEWLDKKFCEVCGKNREWCECPKH